MKGRGFNCEYHKEEYLTTITDLYESPQYPLSSFCSFEDVVVLKSSKVAVNRTEIDGTASGRGVQIFGVRSHAKDFSLALTH